MLTIEQLNAIAAQLNDGVAPLPATSRKWPLPSLRFMIMEQLHDRGLSTNRIGQLMGQSHCTVLHGLQALEDLKAVPGDSEDKQLYLTFQFALRTEEQLIAK